MTYSFLTRTSLTLAAAYFSALAVVVGCSEKGSENSVNSEGSEAVDKVYQERMEAVDKAQKDIRKRLSAAMRAYDEAKQRGESPSTLAQLEQKISSIKNELKEERGKAYQAVRERIKAQTR